MTLPVRIFNQRTASAVFLSIRCMMSGGPADIGAPLGRLVELAMPEEPVRRA